MNVYTYVYTYVHVYSNCITYIHKLNTSVYMYIDSYVYITDILCICTYIDVLYICTPRGDLGQSAEETGRPELEPEPQGPGCDELGKSSRELGEAERGVAEDLL